MDWNIQFQSGLQTFAQLFVQVRIHNARRSFARATIRAKLDVTLLLISRKQVHAISNILNLDLCQMCKQRGELICMPCKKLLCYR